jgi:hypothetical protein
MENNFAYYCVATLILNLTVRLGNTFDLILLLDGIRVGRTTGSVDEFLRQALGHGLQVTEASFTSTSRDQVKSIVDASERTHVHGLATDNTRTTDTGRVFTGTRVDNGIDHHLNGVLVREEVDDFQSVLNNSDSHQLLSSVAALAHQTASEALNDRARGLAKALLLVASGRVGKVGGMITLAGNVIL